jgi:hypothetical protein
MNKTLRRRIAAIELRMPPMVPSAIDRLISIYDILIACAKRAESNGASPRGRAAELRVRQKNWKKALRFDSVGTVQQAELALAAWRTKLLPFVEQSQQNTATC